MRQPVLNAIAATCVMLVPSFVQADSRPRVQFDLPPTVAGESANDPTLVTITLNLSSLIEGTANPPISHWMVQCIPRHSEISIADYAPRTETGSDVSTPIQIKRTEEDSRSAGLSIDGSYGNLVSAHAGSDRGHKNSRSIQYDRVAPMQAVTASGTIRRGRGVYFKLRWTTTQVLEGEKTFSITMRVPSDWRAGLIDVSVKAISETGPSLPFLLSTFDRAPDTIGSADFVVAAYRSGDATAQRRADAVAESEQRLRYLCQAPERSAGTFSLPSLVRRFATKLDWEDEPNHRDSIQRLLAGTANPRLEQQIHNMPMPIRIAVLEYLDSRDQFTACRGTSEQSIAVAKPPL